MQVYTDGKEQIPGWVGVGWGGVVPKKGQHSAKEIAPVRCCLSNFLRLALNEKYSGG